MRTVLFQNIKRTQEAATRDALPLSSGNVKIKANLRAGA